MNHQDYLDKIVAELMADNEWELPTDCRFFLLDELAWNFLYV